MKVGGKYKKKLVKWKNTPVTSHGHTGQRWCLLQWLTSRNPDSQSFITSLGYRTSVTVRDISHCTRLKYFTPVTVTWHQSLYEISDTVRKKVLYETTKHYIRDWSLLAYSFKYTGCSKIRSSVRLFNLCRTTMRHFSRKSWRVIVNCFFFCLKLNYSNKTIKQ